MVIKLSSWLFKPITSLTVCLPRRGCAALQGPLALPAAEPVHPTVPSGVTIPCPHGIAGHTARASCLEDSLGNERCSVRALPGSVFAAVQLNLSRAHGCSQAGQTLCWGGEGSPISLQAAHCSRLFPRESTAPHLGHTKWFTKICT